MQELFGQQDISNSCENYNQYFHQESGSSFMFEGQANAEESLDIDNYQYQVLNQNRDGIVSSFPISMITRYTSSDVQFSQTQTNQQIAYQRNQSCQDNILLSSSQPKDYPKSKNSQVAQKNLRSSGQFDDSITSRSNIDDENEDASNGSNTNSQSFEYQINQADSNIILELIWKRSQKKSASKPTIRSDVIVKTILRIMREFYCEKLDNLTAYRKRKRKNQERTHFLLQADQLVEEIFQKSSLYYGVSLESVSNHLSALIFPKCIAQLNKKKSASQENNEETNIQLASIAQSSIKLRKRERKVIEIANQTQSLLYNYNQVKLHKFKKVTENLFLTYYFLQSSAFAFENNEKQGQIDITLAVKPSGRNIKKGKKNISQIKKKSQGQKSKNAGTTFLRIYLSDPFMQIFNTKIKKLQKSFKLYVNRFFNSKKDFTFERHSFNQ